MPPSPSVSLLLFVIHHTLNFSGKSPHECAYRSLTGTCLCKPPAPARHALSHALSMRCEPQGAMLLPRVQAAAVRSDTCPRVLASVLMAGRPPTTPAFEGKEAVALQIWKADVLWGVLCLSHLLLKLNIKHPSCAYTSWAVVGVIVPVALLFIITILNNLCNIVLMTFQNLYICCPFLFFEYMSISGSQEDRKWCACYRVHKYICCCAFRVFRLF